jgi:hypothetical protein
MYMGSEMFEADFAYRFAHTGPPQLLLQHPAEPSFSQIRLIALPSVTPESRSQTSTAALWFTAPHHMPSKESLEKLGPKGNSVKFLGHRVGPAICLRKMACVDKTTKSRLPHWTLRKG